MKKSVVKFVQEQLNSIGLNAGPVDGLLGGQTLDALNRVDGIPAEWPKTRKAVAFVQLMARQRNINAGPIDGYWGPQTDYAYGVLRHLLETGVLPAPWRPEELSEINPNQWPRQVSDDHLVAFYGEVDTHQTTIDLPYPHRLSWDKRTVIRRFQCHERVHDSLLRILTRVHDTYGGDEIQRLRLDIWGGCFNLRPIRGGTRYSTHSWGAAVDYDPERNRLEWGRERASFSRPEYEIWWRLWEEEGWVSLGRQRNFDWMHVQAVRL